MAEPVEKIENCSEKEVFYKKAEDYWANIDATVDGVLGGFGWISSTDVQGSDQFLKAIIKNSSGLQTNRALDCGAGVGRITKELLVKYFQKTDLVEQNPAFLQVAKQNLSSDDRVGHFIERGLQDFLPREKYDVIWIQWVLGHLTDDDFVNFLRRCVNALSPNGLIIVKENISKDIVVKDEGDSSVTRPYSDYVKLFKEVPVKISKQAKQKNFPSQLFPVKLFALQPPET